MEHNFATRIFASLTEDELTEIDAGWFDKLDQAAKQAYIRLHPQSKYAKYVRRNTKQAPSDISRIDPTKDSLKQMKQHQKEIDYAAKYEKDPAKKKAYQAEADKMKKARQDVEDRMYDKKYGEKEQRRETKRNLDEIKRAEKKETDPRALWEKMIGRENPKAKQDQAEPAAKPASQPQPKAKPKPKAAPKERVEPTLDETPAPKKAAPKPAKPAQNAPQPQQAPQPAPQRKYTPEELQKLYKGGGLAGDYIKDLNQKQTVQVPRQPVKPSPAQQQQVEPEIPENGPKPVSVTN